MKEELNKIISLLENSFEENEQYDSVGYGILKITVLQQLEEYINKQKEISWEEGYGDGANGIPW